MRTALYPLRFAGIAVALSLMVAGLVCIAARRHDVWAQTSSSDTRADRRAGMTIPLLFEPAAVAGTYVAHGPGYRFAFGPAAVELATTDRSGAARVTMEFAGAQVVTPIAESLQPARVHYLLGNDPLRWRTDVPTYDRIRYRGIYDGIDAVFYGKGRHLEYDLVVAPGADPSRPRMRFDGADAVRLDGSGDLVARVAGRELRQSRPVAYQTIDGTRRAVAARYELAGHQARVVVGPYDRDVALVIDPVLIYSTYLGGSDRDRIDDVAVDAAGATYVTGSTASTDFPGMLMPGASPNVTENAFVTKLDRYGRVVYSTVFGASANDAGLGIAVDLSGAAYVVGTTNSVDYPTTAGAFQRTYGGGNQDAFVTKLSPSGSQISYSTFFGGSGVEPWSRLADIAVNAAGQAYITGSTDSGDLPTTAGALDTSNTPGTLTGYVAKLNAAGSGLVYATYLTGTDQVSAAIALDDHDSAVVAGSIKGSMTTTQSFGSLGLDDAFAMLLNATGSKAVFSTRWGGKAGDIARAVAFDSPGIVWVAGATTSTDYPATNSPEYPMHGAQDAFIVKIYWPTGYLGTSRYFGGSGFEDIYGLSAYRGYATVTGITNSTDLPLRDAVQSTASGNTDAFVARFDGGLALLFSTYLGGSGNDYARSVAVDVAGAITSAGFTQSGNFPLAHPADSSGPSGGAYEGYINRFAMVPRGTPGSNDVVVHVADIATLHGNWVKEADSSAAGGFKLHNPDRGLPKLTTAEADPADYFEITLDGLIGEYDVWVRGKADNNSYSNDSVFLQFSYADDGLDEGRQWAPIGSTDGIAIVLEDCTGCGVHGWMWNDDAYGRWSYPRRLNFYPGRQPVTVRVQRREDGISIDQIVFARSPDSRANDPYFTWAPGYQKDDDTIMTPTNGPTDAEIVIYAGNFESHGAWQFEFDETAAYGVRRRHPDGGAAKLTTPLAAPFNYLEKTFHVVGGIPYRLWIRGRADGDSYNNDSLYVQFSGSVTSTNEPIWRIGTTSATTYVLEDCSGCGVKGWGWNDNGYGTGVLGPVIYFAESGLQTIRIQTREDGLAIDQIVLSSQRFMNSSPGAPRNDTTILGDTQD